MADEDVKGTSADAEAPLEDEEQTAAPADEVEETVVEAPDEAAADAEPEPAAEETDAAEEPVAEAAEEAADTAEEPASEDAGGTSAEAEAPAKRKRKRVPRALRPQKTRPKRVRSTERKPMVRLDTPAHDRGRRQERQGKVVSDAMEKTIVVEVAVVKAHPRYKKVVRRSVKFHAHDERSEAKVGDLVRIVETRPLSKTKRWRLVEVVEAAK